MTVRIVSDTACDLPDEAVGRLGIGLVPLHVRFGNTEFLDRRQLDAKEFWARCAGQPELPTTAAPSPGAFREAFEAMAADGADAVVCVTLSAKLSATYESAAQAAKAMSGELEVQVVDSRSATVGQGLLVLAAADKAAEGAALTDVVATASSTRDRLSVMGTIDTLENLKKGGRIGGAAAALGTLLSIKPVIEVRDGVVEQESRQRTRAKSLRYIADKARSAGPLERLAVAGAHAADFDEFVLAIADIASRYPRLVGEIGPVIATHAGPGTIGVAWVTEAGR
jgi:DegV family protein with EDD domain